MGIGKTLSQLNIEEFTGGCNYAEDLTSIAQNESPNAMNVIFEGTTVRKRNGYLEVNRTSTGSSDRGNGLFNIDIESLGNKQVCHFGTSVYSMTNLNGTMTAIRTGAPDHVSFNAKVKQNLIQCYYNNSAPYYWDGSTASMAILSASAPGFRYPIEYQGYLLGGNITGARLRIYYEDINSMIGGAYADYFTLSGGSGDEHTGWFILNGRLYASTRTSISRVSFIGGSAVFDYKQVIATTGVVPRTAQTVVTSEFGEVCMFMGFDKNIYMFDGSFVRAVSNKYREPNNDAVIAMSLVDEFYLEANCHATYDTVKQIYRLFVTKKGSTQNNYCLNIDVRNLAYYPFDNMGFHSSVIASDAIGRRFFVMADYAGKIHKLFVNRNNDNGTAIIEYYEAPPLVQRTSNIKKQETIDLYFAPRGNYVLRMDERVDFDKTWSRRADLKMLGTRDRSLGINSVLGTTASLGSEYEALHHSVNVPVTDNVYRFRLGTNGTADTICSYNAGTVAATQGLSLLLKFNGTDASTTFTDSSINARTVTPNGSVQIDTAQSKFGTASGLFNGTTDYLSIADSDDFLFDTGDFTIDCWVRFNSLTGEQQFFNQYVDGANNITFGKDSSNNIYFVFTSGGVNYVYVTGTPGTPLAINTWYHVAIVRTGNSFKVFVDGVQAGNTETYAGAVPNYSASIFIGRYGSGSGYFFNGWMDQLRVVKGYALWTTNFSVPTSETSETVSVTVTGSSTVWTSDMTPTNKYKIWFDVDGLSNNVYDFTYVSATTGTVALPMGYPFSGATYEIYRTDIAECACGWELYKIGFNQQVFNVGTAEARR